MNRRQLLLLSSFASLAAGWQLWGVRRPLPEFVPLRGAPGWRFAAAGGVSGASGRDLMTVGLEAGPAPLANEDPWHEVHRDAVGGGVPVAMFTDFFCPYCHALTAVLRARQARPRLSITWHELPLLGPNSKLVARAAEAAALQGGYLAFHDQLVRDGFRPTPRWLAEIGGRAGLNPEQLLADLNGPEVAGRMDRTAQAASRMGVFGTPGLVIRRDVIVGSVQKEVLEHLIAGP